MKKKYLLANKLEISAELKCPKLSFQNFVIGWLWTFPLALFILFLNDFSVGFFLHNKHKTEEELMADKEKEKANLNEMKLSVGDGKEEDDDIKRHPDKYGYLGTLHTNPCSICTHSPPSGFTFPSTEEAEEMPLYSRYMSHLREPRRVDFFSRRRYEDAWEGEEESCCSSFFSRLYGKFRFRMAHTYFLMRVFMEVILTSSSIMVTSIIACFSAWGCYELDLEANIPITILASALIFPLSFGINSAYQRRERTLLEMNGMKVQVMEIYLLARNWTRHQPDNPIYRDYKIVLIRLLQEMEKYVTGRGGKRTLFKIYRSLDRLSNLNERLRSGVSFISSPISTMYQYNRQLRHHVENIRASVDFRTSVDIRSYSFWGCSILGFFWAPYFAYLGMCRRERDRWILCLFHFL